MKIPFYKRFGVRLTFVLTVCFALYPFGEEWIGKAVLKSFNLVNEDQVLLIDDEPGGHDPETCDNPDCPYRGLEEGESITAGMLGMDEEFTNPNAKVVFLTSAEMEEHERKLNVWWQVASLALSAALAALFGFIISRFFTRRINRLAEWAGTMDVHSVDSTADVAGSDEIRHLATTLEGINRHNRLLVSDLEHASKERLEWVAQVSHDLRTPLTSLLLSLEHEMNQETIRSDPDFRRKFLSEARSDALRVAELAEDLLAVARLDSGFPLSFEMISPGEVVHKASHSIQRICEMSEVALQTEVEPNVPLIWADGNLLVRAIENLLGNSHRFAKSRVWIAVAQHELGVQFTVGDDGEGLQAAEVRRVSDKENHGLGLQLVSKVLEGHSAHLNYFEGPDGENCVSFVIAEQANEQAMRPGT